MSFEIKIALHVLAGIFCAFMPQLVWIWVFIIIFYEGTFRVYHTKNVWGQAHFAAAYMAAMEMVVRMSKTGLPHELTKYAVIFILLNGLIVQPRLKAACSIFLIFFLLQLPSVLFLTVGENLELARQLLSFNLSGPLCLTTACIYFYRKPMSKEDVIHLFRAFLLPIVATVSWLFARTPNISELSFLYGANYAASGYGPNQMASLLGFGILIIGLSLLFKLRLFKTNILAYLLLLLIAYRGVLTFSRGGIAGPLIVLSCMIGYFVFTNQRFRAQFGRIIIVGGLFALTAYGVYFYVNQKTEEALFNRYAGISYGKQVDTRKYTSGRLDILLIDVEIFLDNPFWGIGPGMGRDAREEYGYYQGKAAAHIEFSRLLAEHGLLGLVALIILVGFPLREFYLRKTLETRFLLFAGVLFCFTFMLHSATRIALPMFMYGLGFALPVFRLSNKY